MPKHKCKNDRKWWKEVFPTLTKEQKEIAVEEVNKSKCLFCRQAMFVGRGWVASIE